MTTKAEEIQMRMQAVRHEINEDVDTFVEKAKSLVDWRDYVRAHPWAAIGVAAAAGYFLVPRGKKIMHADPATVADMMKSGKVVLAPDAQVKQSKPFVSGLLTTLTGVLVRTVAGQVGHQVAARFSESIDPPE